MTGMKYISAAVTASPILYMRITSGSFADVYAVLAAHIHNVM